MRKIQITAAQVAVLMAIFTLGSKCVGFVREMVIANYYGAGFIVDAYSMAQSIPTMIFGSLFSAVSTSYMPIFSKKYELEGPDAANYFTSRVINIVGIISIFCALVGLFGSEQVVRLIADFKDPETIALTSFYLKITSGFIIFNSLVTLLEAFLQYRGSFVPQIVVGYVQSGVIIAFAVIGAYTSYYYLAFGILIGCMIRTIGIAFLAARKGLRYHFDWELGDATKEIVVLALPVFFGGSINQINAFVDRMLASGLQDGSLSALNYSNLIVQTIYGLTITIMVTIIYPKMTQANALKDYERLGSIVERGINLTVLIALPCTLGAMVYSDEIIQIVYERGAFDQAATALTAPAFFYYSIGLVFICLNALLVKVYYSLGNPKTPVLCGLFGMLVNVGLNLLLVRVMAHAGLALATSVAAGVNAVSLYSFMRRKYPQIRLIRSTKRLWLTALISILSVAASYGVYRFLLHSFDWPLLVLLGAAVLVAGIVYLVLLYAARFEELQLIKDVFKRG